MFTKFGIICILPIIYIEDYCIVLLNIKLIKIDYTSGGIECEIKEVNDSKMIAQLGIVQMPALLVNGEIVVQGTDFQKTTLIKVLDGRTYA